MLEKNSHYTKLSEENIILKESLNGYRQFVFSFSEMCNAMAAIQDVDKLIAFFVSKIAEIFRASRVSFMMLDEIKKELFLKAAEGLKVDTGRIRLKLGEPFGGWVAKNGDPLLVKDVEREYPQLSRNRVARYMSKSFLIFPVKIKEDMLGVLSLTDKKDRSIFTEEDLRLIALAVRSLALHIESIKLSQKANGLLKLDPLTDIPNHRHFQEQLFEEISRAERYRRPLSLIMLDIDNFSDYNQDFGYPAGDNVLKQITKIIKENIRQIDSVSRYGPEEFAVILPETKLKEAILVAERIREKIAQAIFTDSRTSSLGMSRITVSAGLVQQKAGLSKEELICRADSALLEAKQKGKNCVCVYK